MAQDRVVKNGIQWTDQPGYCTATRRGQDDGVAQQLGGVHRVQGDWWAVMGQTEQGPFKSKKEAKLALEQHFGG